MGTIHFTSDHHFFHANFLKFRDAGGGVIRPFADVDAMNEHMVERWNSVVKDGDKVYHLGDVTFNYGKEFRALMARLKGRKRLVLGNHDIIKGTTLMDYFEKISLWRIFKEHNFVCTHIPIPPTQFRHKVQYNLHGHIHQNVMMEKCYINVCVEHHDYTPVSLDWVIEEIKKRERT